MVPVHVNARPNNSMSAMDGLRGRTEHLRPRPLILVWDSIDYGTAPLIDALKSAGIRELNSC
eukprot:CAMPEP_0197867590 /NCGR_PEP_ID=MMETSP1438-20131217/44839_1 /TAXON_ID=1461541 /ORGANISM="Pterosperma sp., Strain CCMP1384" /LENGTH=61 /DNA_ID=CAMNT_0043486251 /DNA_START=558 /DNA_END=743 /DNA_ORIENTATION=+